MSQLKSQWCEFVFRSHGCRWGDKCRHAHSKEEFQAAHPGAAPWARDWEWSYRSDWTVQWRTSAKDGWDWSDQDGWLRPPNGPAKWPPAPRHTSGGDYREVIIGVENLQTPPPCVQREDFRQQMGIHPNQPWIPCAPITIVTPTATVDQGQLITIVTPTATVDQAQHENPVITPTATVDQEVQHENPVDQDAEQVQQENPVDQDAEQVQQERSRHRWGKLIAALGDLPATADQEQATADQESEQATADQEPQQSTDTDPDKALIAATGVLPATADQEQATADQESKQATADQEKEQIADTVPVQMAVTPKGFSFYQKAFVKDGPPTFLTEEIRAKVLLTDGVGDIDPPDVEQLPWNPTSDALNVDSRAPDDGHPAHDDDDAPEDEHPAGGKADAPDDEHPAGGKADGPGADPPTVVPADVSDDERLAVATDAVARYACLPTDTKAEIQGIVDKWRQRVQKQADESKGPAADSTRPADSKGPAADEGVVGKDKGVKGKNKMTTVIDADEMDKLD